MASLREHWPDTEFPFQLSREEHAIIDYNKSGVLLLGRSGTGKTTCIVFRLYSLFQQYHQAAVAAPLYTGPRPELPTTLPAGEIVDREEYGARVGRGKSALHQIFVTASPALCDKVRKYFLRLKATAEREKGALTSAGGGDVSGGEKRGEEDSMEAGGGEAACDEDDDDSMFRGVPNDFHSLKEEHFPLFLTYTKLLHMLEATAAETGPSGDGGEGCSGGALPGEEWQSSWHAEGTRGKLSLGMESGEIEEKEGRRWTGKEEDLQEADSDSESESESGTAQGRGRNGPLSPGGFRGREVTFEVFEYAYWPHLDEKKTKHQDASLVWAEIMAVIKGSEAAVQSDTGRISASEYFSLSDRNFTAFRHDRPLLYALYEQYEEMKRRRGEHDMMDRVHKVYQLLQERGYTGQPVHEVYSDEVQDLTVAQVKLLLSMCHLPKGEGEDA
jgi:hypothetical protein